MEESTHKFRCRLIAQLLITEVMDEEGTTAPEWAALAVTL